MFFQGSFALFPDQKKSKFMSAKRNFTRQKKSLFLSPKKVQGPTSGKGEQSLKTPANQSDKLVLLQQQAAKARDLELDIATFNEGIAQCKEQLKDLQNDKMPSLMDELKIDNIGVPPDGNKPGVDYKLIQQIGASISSKWSEPRLQQAFDLLKKMKAESLIKTEVSAKLPKGNLKQAKALVAAAKKLKITADLKQTVHAGTLSAWLKEIYAGGQSLSQSDLEKIGGYVGRVVKAEERE